jgi:hypothetical protein
MAVGSGQFGHGGKTVTYKSDIIFFHMAGWNQQ